MDNRDEWKPPEYDHKTEDLIRVEALFFIKHRVLEITIHSDSYSWQSCTHLHFHLLFYCKVKQRSNHQDKPCVGSSGVYGIRKDIFWWYYRDTFGFFSQRLFRPRSNVNIILFCILNLHLSANNTLWGWINRTRISQYILKEEVGCCHQPNTIMKQIFIYVSRLIICNLGKKGRLIWLFDWLVAMTYLWILSCCGWTLSRGALELVPWNSLLTIIVRVTDVYISVLLALGIIALEVEEKWVHSLSFGDGQDEEFWGVGGAAVLGFYLTPPRPTRTHLCVSVFAWGETETLLHNYQINQPMSRSPLVHNTGNQLWI